MFTPRLETYGSSELLVPSRQSPLLSCLVMTSFCVVFILFNIYYFTSTTARTVDGAELIGYNPVDSSMTNLITTTVSGQNNWNDSTCDDSATQRGPHQKVISFSFYGKASNGRDYFQGIEKNAKILNTFYPGWLMRVYHDVRDKDALKVLERLKQEYGSFLDLCFAGQLPKYGNIIGTQQNMWRFLTLDDPLVDISLFRDLDSNFNEREVQAVHEWLESDYPLHVMRDHPGHHDAILAGMWGVRLDTGFRELWVLSLGQMMNLGAKAGKKSLDQSALAQVVWPLTLSMKNFVMQHDSYSCKDKFAAGGGMRPFPTCRNLTVGMNFVGSRRTIDTEPKKYVCPVKCRSNKKCIYC